MEHHVTLGPESPIYWIGWAITLFVWIFPILFGRRFSGATRKNFERSWAATLGLSFLIFQILAYKNGTLSWSNSLPVHLCGFSRWMMIFYLWNPAWLTTKLRANMGELVTFTGFAGGLQSVLTPEFTNGSQAFYIFDFYVTHASIMTIAMYIILVHGQQLKKGAAWRSFNRIQFLALAAFLANLATGGNYMYLMEPPIADNPLIITQARYPGLFESLPFLYKIEGVLHVLFFEVFALLNFLLLEVLFRRVRAKRLVVN